MKITYEKRVNIIPPPHTQTQVVWICAHSEVTFDETLFRESVANLLVLLMVIMVVILES